MTNRRTSQGWKSTALLALFTATAVVLAGVLAQAAFYRYTNETGKQVFVDDPGQIPDEFRDGAEVYT